jgi:large subunit ribosomal protein L7/L12
VTDGGYDWTAFASGFGVALLLGLLLRWRKGRRKDLIAPSQAEVTVRLAAGIPGEIRAQTLRLKAEGRSIEAIKLVRERTGCDLKAAKDAVDALR